MIKNKKKNTTLSKVLLQLKPSLKKCVISDNKKKQKNTLKYTIKFIGLDFSKKLANIVSFVIFAV
ncbi:hypothetical protein DUT90_10390 [Polaribacter sp. WD7]|uniref:hypothetical protein n=1 Tax=Polaribacter sp. WD7 TaxID=2269061 RepID=UPI000DF29627|nr:hypothetical protein DUT90_10390 [Polaribacter sp. WD7]